MDKQRGQQDSSSDAEAFAADPSSPEVAGDDCATSQARISIPCLSSEVACHMIVLLTGEPHRGVTVDDALMKFDSFIREEEEEIKGLEEIRNYYDSVIVKRTTA
jgi:hypothetical protein